MTKKTKQQVKNETSDIQPMDVKKGLIPGKGRRKTAVARVFLYEGKGEFIVNGKDIEEYFPGEKAKTEWMKPFHVVGVSHPNAHFNATIKVQGSGKAGQLDAVVHALSWALANVNEEYASTIRKHSLLTRDPRMVERKKPYLKKARKAPQYSKR